MTILKVGVKRLVTFLWTALFFCQTRKCQADYNSCGLRSVHTRGKIFGGLQSRPGMWPWQVAIYRTSYEGQRPRFHCGGALINSRWVVSAAHCFFKAPSERHVNYRYTITAGEFKIFSSDPGEQKRNAFKIHIYPNFKASTYENDIALVALDKGVKMGPSVRAICLPRDQEALSVTGKKVSIAGWGFTTKGTPSPTLLYSEFQIQSNKKCHNATEYRFNETVMFCAGDGKGGNDTCKGDSGGSTAREVIRNGRRRWVTVGLVSWGEGCGIKGTYGYYTRMEPFVPWIQRKINTSIFSCGNPGNIPHGTMIGSDFLVGFAVKYTCNEGYQLRGRSKIRCKRNGKWSRAPKCHKVECKDPGIPRYGVRRPRKSNYYYKDKVRFRCKANYTIVGKSSVVCQFDGIWNGFKPACLAPCNDPGVPEGGVRLDHSFKHGQTVRFICRKKKQRPSVSFLTCNNGRWNRNSPRCNSDCNDPGVPTNGKRQGNRFTLGEKIYFTCNQGFQRVGPEYLQCYSNGKWSDKMPICEPLSCSKPALSDNAYIYSRTKFIKEKFRFKEVVLLRCRDGYLSSGWPFQECLAGGWTTSNFRCSPKSCGDPGTPANGRREGIVFTFNKKVRFTCNRGYMRVGPEYLRCQSNQTWTDKTPFCRLAGCGRLPEPQYGEKIEETSTTFGRKVVFRCIKEGFELKGSAHRVCQENGKWSGTRTICERVECMDPGTLSNGVRRPDKNKYVFEDRIYFQCDTNHTLRGDPFIMCKKTKDWTGSVPRCLAPCRDPGIPTGGSRLQHSFLHNNVVQFRCNEGWPMEGSHTIRCNNGQWDRDPPTCNKMCSRPKNPANGGIYDSAPYVLHGSSIRFYCRGGYNLVGQEYGRCRNGTWNSRQPTCKPVECRDPGTPRNGVRRPDKNKYVFEDRMNFQCKTNYTLIGYRSITCEKDKTWSGTAPQCLAPCRDPGTPNNGQRHDNSFLHGNQVRFSCRQGWNIEGSQTISCNIGRWDQPTPKCKGVCPALGAPANGDILDTNFDYKARVRFRCNQGYTMDGPPILICFNGKWSSDPPTCKAPCSSPGFLRNGRRRGNNFAHGGSVEFFCDHGYDLFGAQTIKCEDGKWSSPVPTCETGCSYLEIPEGMKTQGNVGKSRSTVSFSCTRPLVLTGKSVLTCIDGSWSDRLPTCSECGSALGMETRNIPDGNIQASSTRDPYRHTAKEGRLNGPRAWCSGRETQPYLEIDFGKPYRITGLATQGSAYDNRWVRWYSLKSNLAGSTFVTYRENGNVKLFEGNKDTNTQVRQKLRNPFISRRLQIYPTKQGGYHTYPACMRVEIYGCDLPLDCVMVRSRVVAKWISLHSGMYIYLKAYLTNIGKRYWRVELENENHGSPWNKDFPKYANIPFVLDVPPKHEELQVGTRVLVPWGYRYFTGTIRRTRVHRYNRYQVRADDGDEKHLTIDQIRLLKAPRFCE